MKHYNSLIFYYAVAVVTILLIGSIFFFPRPFNIIQPLVLAPIFLFFWLRITSPEQATETSWSGRLVVVLLSLSGLGVLGYYLASQTAQPTEVQVASLDTKNMEASVSAELAALRAEIQSLRSESTPSATSSSQPSQTALVDLLNSLEEPVATPAPELRTVKGYVRVKNTEAIDVYQESQISARIIGIALPNLKMPFYQSAGNWYEIEYEESLTGWVKATDVVEVTGT